jgi:hypothetical protein
MNKDDHRSIQEENKKLIEDNESKLTSLDVIVAAIIIFACAKIFDEMFMIAWPIGLLIYFVFLKKLF